VTTLDQAAAGTPVRIAATRAPGPLARRLAELGIRADEVVVPLHRTAGGGRLVAVADTRVALARDVLRLVDTSPADEQVPS
jgi:ferrous iron transport protein A